VTLHRVSSDAETDGGPSEASQLGLLIGSAERDAESGDLEDQENRFLVDRHGSVAELPRSGDQPRGRQGEEGARGTIELVEGARAEADVEQAVENETLGEDSHRPDDTVLVDVRHVPAPVRIGAIQFDTRNLGP